MLKKAKLYSLLLVIVVSTVVGLFGSHQVAHSQAPEVASPFNCDQDRYKEYCDTVVFELDNEGNAVSKDAVYYLGAKYTRSTDLAGFQRDGTCQSTDDRTQFFDGSSSIFISDQYTSGNGYQAVSVIYLSGDIETATTVGYQEFALGITGSREDNDDFSDEEWADFTPCYLSKAPGTNIDIPNKGELKFSASLGMYEEPETPQGNTPTPQTCQIKGIGWLICPVVNFLAEITDQSYNLLNKYLLKLEPIALPGAADGERMQLYDSWKMMRDFANIVFIIGFLIIVFSQITSFGVTNYGIKRLLPKIIIAAILVNISYFLCAVAVDLSNILGNSLRDLLMPRGDATLEFNFIHDPDEPAQTATGFVGISDIVLGAVLTGAVVYTFLPVFLPLVISAALAVITAVIVLTLRQALVVILIVVSPLAFVALLLPNTESYFQKWRSLFTAMLLVYPIISVVFGASALASSILMTATDDFWTQMVGAGVAIIPLFITPILMKVSGGLLNRWVGLVNDPTKGPIDGMRNSLRDRGQIIRAGRAKRYGDFTNKPTDKSTGAFGRAGSMTRRLATLGTAYGQNNRTRARKDKMGQIESELEQTYLDSEQGQRARNAAKNAQVSVQNAQINAESIRLESAQGIALQTQATTAETRKHAAEAEAQAAAISAIPHALETRAKEADLSKQIAENTSKMVGIEGANTDLKMQAATSAQNVANAEGRDKQAYEEVAAAGTSDPGLLATHDVDTTTAAAARNASFQSKAIGSATSTASSVGESNFAKTLDSTSTTYDPTLLAQAGGNVDRARGISRARGRAADVTNKDEEDAIENVAKTMTRTNIVVDPRDPTAPHLQNTFETTTNQVEDRTAAMLQTIRRGTDKDVMRVANYVTSLPDNDETKTMQQFVFAEIEKRRPQMALGASIMAQGKAGNLHPTLAAGTRRVDPSTGRPVPSIIDGSTTTDSALDQSMRDRLIAGKFNPMSIVKAPIDQADHMVDVLENGVDRTTIAASANFRQLQTDITNFIAGIDDRPESERPTPEMLARLRRIEAIP